MADIISPKQRSAIMARIRSKDTRPELLVRKIVFSLGYRYRLHVRQIPGCPDLVFRPRQKVIFVHGCFWHHHAGCPFAHIPKSRVDFWKPKLQRNQERDKENERALAQAGWMVLTVWECQLKNTRALEKILQEFLDRKP
jgi:DNA mismatch endonuclease (patch repair protein)